MSKILIKLVDEAIIPSLLLVLARIGGLFLSTVIFNLEFSLSKVEERLFPYKLIFESIDDANLANNVSNIFMMIAAAAGFAYAVYKLNAYHEKRISPTRLLDLADKGMLAYIETSFGAYSKALVWLIFMWISAILATYSSSGQMTHVGIAAAGLILSALSTLILVKNLELDYTENTDQIKKEN